MDQLNILFAIAITMAIFSSLTSMVVEGIRKLIHSRRRGLRRMLENMVSDEAMFGSEPGQLTEENKDWVNRLLESAIGKSDLPVRDFIRRFAETKEGKILGKWGREKVEVVIDDLAQRYDEYGRRETRLFKNRSYVYSIVVSVAIAFALNINIITLYSGFIRNPELTSAIIELESKKSELLRAAKPEPNDNKISTSNELQTEIKEIQGRLDTIQSIGLPIGRSVETRFPDFVPNEYVNLFLEQLCIFLTGMLIALGGPFWFDVIKRLRLLSGVLGALGKTEEKSTVNKQSKPVADATNRKELIEVFLTVLESQQLLSTQNSKERINPYGAQI